MQITLTQFTHPTPAHYQLLLTADPEKAVIDSYLSRSFCYQATQDERLVGVVILLPTRTRILEIVNLAVAEDWQDQGIGGQLLTFAETFARQNNYLSLEVGTGTTSFGPLRLYQKFGFRVTGVDRDFFTRHYSHEIKENGLLLKDMLRLEKVL